MRWFIITNLTINSSKSLVVLVDLTFVPLINTKLIFGKKNVHLYRLQSPPEPHLPMGSAPSLSDPVHNKGASSTAPKAPLNPTMMEHIQSSTISSNNQQNTHATTTRSKNLAWAKPNPNCST